MSSLVIRPGLLVSLRTSVRGGVHYSRQDIAPPVEGAEAPADSADEGAAGARPAVSAWETVRTIADPEEHRRAIEVRGRCRTIVTRQCVSSAFGLLCPQSREAALQDAVAEAGRLAAEFNRSARHSRIDVYVITGRVADSDLQAARAIGAEVRELVQAMQAGVAAADPDAIREAATKARALAGMLAPEVAGRVSDAISAARSAAREIVRRVERDGERAADVVRSLRVEALELGRFAALDLDAAAEVAPVMPAEARAVDLFADPPAEAAETAPAAPAAPAAPTWSAPDLDDDDGRAPLEMAAAAAGMVPALDFVGA